MTSFNTRTAHGESTVQAIGKLESDALGRWHNNSVHHKLRNIVAMCCSLNFRRKLNDEIPCKFNESHKFDQILKIESSETCKRRRLWYQSIDLGASHIFSFGFVVIGLNAEPQIHETFRESRHLFSATLRLNSSSHQNQTKRC